MGESKRNPLAAAYQGPLPEVLIGGKIGVRPEASGDFMVRLGLWQNDPVNAGQNPPEPKEADCDAVFYLVGTMILPSALIPNRNAWPAGDALMGEIFRMPYSEFVERVYQQNPHMRGSKVESTSPTEPEVKPV